MSTEECHKEVSVSEPHQTKPNNEAQFKKPEFFKIPSISPKISKAKEPALQNKEKSTEKATSTNTALPQKHTPVSFLPSTLYKSHRPSAAEFLERHEKLQKSKPEDQPPVEKEILTSSDTPKIDPESPQKPQKKVSPKLEYEAPKWGCIVDAEDSYSLEVLKVGAIIDKVELKDKDYFLFGRLDECDVKMEHPSISRHHAILQFGQPGENDKVELQKDGSSGFYLLDLGSTHGTIINKTKIPDGKYYRLKVGHMIKFGGSSRMYILQGPQEDAEEETKETLTELKQKAKERREKEDLAKMMLGEDSDEEGEEKSSRKAEKSDCEAGISWGMLEDAVAEEEEEETKEEESVEKMDVGNLFSEKKEPFYVKDPHKALKHFHEREGTEIDFDCTERRPGQWCARLELPIATPSGKAVVAEASVTGKRRDAVNNCALEACRLLEKYGMFKRNQHAKRSGKEWEKEDFYDSDEDQFLDRTGELDMKRKRRKMRIGIKLKKNEEKAETYDSLKSKIEIFEKEIKGIEDQLEKDKKATHTDPNSVDSLEHFMRQVREGKTLDSMTRSKLKLRLFELRKDLGRLMKLAEIARPVSLPSTASSSMKSMKFIGRMKGKKKGMLVASQAPIPQIQLPTQFEGNENVVEYDNDGDIDITRDSKPRENAASNKNTEDREKSENKIENNVVNITKLDAVESDLCKDNGGDIKSLPNSKEIDNIANGSSDLSNADNDILVDESKRKRLLGPTLPDEIKQKINQENEEKIPNDNEEPVKRKRRRNRNREKKTVATKPADKANVTNDPDYSDWLPPQNQSGDGTTSLNAKYGY